MTLSSGSGRVGGGGMHAESDNVVDTSVDSIVSQYSAAQCDPSTAATQDMSEVVGSVDTPVQVRLSCRQHPLTSPHSSPP